MTIDDLAVATQQEFQLVREEMKESKAEILQVLVSLINEKIDRLEMHLSAYASRTNDDIERLQEFVQEHGGRLRVLENGK